MTARPDAKAVELAGRLRRLGLDTMDDGARWASLQIGREGVDCLARSLHDDTNCPLSLVGNPTDQTEVLRTPHHEPAKADSLDAAVNRCFETFVCHQWPRDAVTPRRSG